MMDWWHFAYWVGGALFGVAVYNIACWCLYRDRTDHKQGK